MNSSQNLNKNDSIIQNRCVERVQREVEGIDKLLIGARFIDTPFFKCYQNAIRRAMQDNDPILKEKALDYLVGGIAIWEELERAKGEIRGDFKETKPLIETPFRADGKANG